MPAAVCSVPAGHAVQDVHEAALALVLKVPDAHGVQTRFVVALPATEAYSPALQFVMATHAVAELASSSQVPLAQAVFGVAPPGQYVPAGHAAQTAGVVAVAGEVCSVPA